MNTTAKYAHLVGLSIALSIALPSSAEEQDAASNKLYPTAKPMTVRTAGPSRAIESPQMQESAADVNTPQKKVDVPDPAVTPYMTYEGATSSNTDH